MKKILAIAFSLSLFAMTANAQVKRNTNPSQSMQSDSSHKMRQGNMMKDLNLTTQQKAQLKESQQAMKQQRDAIKNDATLTQDQKKAKMQDLRKTQQDKLNSILTPEQKAKMAADKKDWKGKPGQSAHAEKERKGNGPMMKDLNLTDTQKAQMKSDRDDMKQQRDAIQNDATLTQAQKKVKMQDLMKSERSKMSSILTPEQKAKMQADRKNSSKMKKDAANMPQSNG